MRKINDFDKVQENGGGFKRIPDGAYIVGVKKVAEVSDKEFLRLELDICKGEYKNWYQQQYDADTRETKYWPRDGVLVRSYKEKALPFFKGFITAVTKSNPKFEWKWNEQDLKNKVFGVVVGTEEYLKKNGGVGTRPYIDSVHSVEAIENGDYTVPDVKKLDTTKATSKPAEPFVNPFSDSAPSIDPFANTDSAPAAESNPWDDSDVNPFA